MSTKRKHQQVPKLIGSDTETAAFVTGIESPERTCAEATALVLDAVDGVPANPSLNGHGDYATGGGYYGYGTGSHFNPQDSGRKFLLNGGCIYNDLNHPEICTPEVLSARAHIAAHHGALRFLGDIQQRVNATLKEGFRLVILINNSDGRDNSYGGHTNFLMAGHAWNRIFQRRLTDLLGLASFQASSIVFTGQGKVGSENGTPACDFQIAQRADFYEQVVGAQTTYARPICNVRDEPLCGRLGTMGAKPDYKRYHNIFHDTNLAHGAHFLKLGTTQVILSLLETRSFPAQLALEDPVGAVVEWSHDPTLRAKARLLSGRKVTAVELQLMFCEHATEFVKRGGCDGFVPEALEICNYWADTLEKLRAGNFPALARRLDWVLKREILERSLRKRPEFTWQSAEIKHLDQIYGALDGGLFRAMEKAGAVDRMVSDADIERAVHEAPANTRAFGRTRLLRLARETGSRVEQVDWDSVSLNVRGSGWPKPWTVRLDDPLGFTAANTSLRDAITLPDALAALGDAASETKPQTSHSPYYTTQNIITS